MATTNTQNEFSEQHILNKVYDKDNGLLFVQDLAQNTSLDLCYTGTQLTSIVKHLGNQTYTKTLTYSGDTLVNVSEWV